MTNLTNLIRIEIENVSERFNKSEIEEARQCYTQYVNLIVEDAPKRERYGLLNYWDKLIK